jgi:hypothetical protein
MGLGVVPGERMVKRRESTSALPLWIQKRPDLVPSSANSGDMDTRSRKDGAKMRHMIQVEAARIPDRDRLLRTLTEHGHDARPVDEVGIVVHYPSGRKRMRREVFRLVEDDVIALGSAFVPQKHEGVIYLRPPVG